MPATTVRYRPKPLGGVTINLPLSKSMEARAHAIAYLRGVPAPYLPSASLCSDSRVMRNAIHTLRQGGTHLHAGQSGTALRILTAICATEGEGKTFVITRHPQLTRRPLEPLLNALRQCTTATFSSQGDDLTVHAGNPRHGITSVAVDTTGSSQYATALALIGHTRFDPVMDPLTSQDTSMPYLRMTYSMLAQASPVEADWSAAANFLAFCAIDGRDVDFFPMPTPPAHSLQGDSAALGIFQRMAELTHRRRQSTILMGAPVGSSPTPAECVIRADLSQTPDLLPPLAVACVATGLPFTLSGIAHTSLKECDRPRALVTELAKAGVTLTRPDHGTLKYVPPRLFHSPMPRTPSAPLCTYGDHRMAMALALMAIPLGQVTLDDTACTDKSYPGFWQELGKLGFTQVNHTQ